MSPGSFQGASAVLHRLFETILAPHGAAALVLPDGTALHVASVVGAADISTIEQTAALCQRYLKLGDRDLAITNDPYSGGTALSDFTLVLGIKIEGSGGEADLLLARRLSFSPWLETPRASTSLKLDDEGVRVPPTPLASAGVLNRDLLSAISAHPKSPRTLSENTIKAFEELKSTAARLKRIAADPGTILRKANFKNYLEDSSRAFEMLMTRLPLGTTIVTHQFPSGENLKLQLRITEDRVHFDFAGSENSPRLAITELATFGACFAATVSAFDEKLPFNAGTFQHLQVSAPARTILSAAPPAATLRGMTEGIGAVCHLAKKAIAKLAPPMKTADASGTGPMAILVFNDGRSLDLSIAPGGAASAQSPGPDALNIWKAANTPCWNLTDTERSLPVKIISMGQRASSGGNGRNSGGHGSVIGVRALESCELRWIVPGLGSRVDGADGGRAGQPASIEITEENGGTRIEISEAEGRRSIAAGDQVFILSAGGGGFGEVKESEVAE